MIQYVCDECGEPIKDGNTSKTYIQIPLTKSKKTITFTIDCSMAPTVHLHKRCFYSAIQKEIQATIAEIDYRSKLN